MPLPVCSWCWRTLLNVSKHGISLKCPLRGTEALIRPTAFSCVQRPLKALFFFLHLSNYEAHNTPFSARSRRLPKGLIAALSRLSSLKDQVWTSKWFHIRRQLRLAFKMFGAGAAVVLVRSCKKKKMLEDNNKHTFTRARSVYSYRRLNYSNTAAERVGATRKQNLKQTKLKTGLSRGLQIVLGGVKCCWNKNSVTLTTVPFSCDSSKACWEGGGGGLGPSWAWRQQKSALKMLQLWGCFRAERLTWPVQHRERETFMRKPSQTACRQRGNTNLNHTPDTCAAIFPLPKQISTQTAKT